MMKKLLIKLFIFLMVIVLSTHLLNYASGLVAVSNNARFLEEDKHLLAQLLSSKESVTALAIGNSHTQAIDFEAFDYTGFRVARAGRDMFEIKAYLEFLLPQLSNVEVVFIPVSYFTFQRDNAASSDVRIRRIHTYTTLPTWHYVEGDFSNFLIGKLHPVFPITNITRSDSWEAVAYALYIGTWTAQAQDSLLDHDTCQNRGHHYLNAHAQLRAPQHIRYANEMMHNHPNLEQDVYEVMSQIINQLKQNNIRVIFFTPPYLKTYTDTYQDQDLQAITDMRQMMHDLAHTHNIEYYGFSADQNFIHSETLFADSDHLNPCGAAQFSKKLQKALKKLDSQ